MGEDDVEEAIARYHNPVNKFCRMVKNKSKKRDDKRTIVKQFRSGFELPPNEFNLVKGLTQLNDEKRMSVRDARLTPYIDDVLDDHNYKKELTFLKLVTNANNQTSSNHK